MNSANARKRRRNRLQEGVLKRLETGLPPTHWQQFRLHLHTAWRQRRKMSLRRTWFHTGGVLRMLWKPVTLVTLAGVPVQLHLTCLVYPGGLLAFLAWHEQAGRSMMLVLAFTLLGCGGLLVHEFAHILTARRLGIGTRRMVFIPFGAFAELTEVPPARHELIIAAAGPLASLTLAGCFWLLLSALEMSHAKWTHLPWLICLLGAWLNLLLAIFNLLPCFPMDGGRILRSLLAVVIGRAFPRQAGRAVVIATRIAVRYAAWPVAVGMIALTIWHTYLWLNLLMFPLLLLLAEIEYWLLRTEPDQETEKTTN